VNDPKEAAARELRKAHTLFSVFAGMGGLASFFTPWRPRKFVGAKTPKPPRTRPATSNRERSPEHVAAVATMRAARRAKRIAQAETLLEAKRRRQTTQIERHLRRVSKKSRKQRLADGPHPIIPAPHFIAH
jgi:hypothetical protein